MTPTPRFRTNRDIGASQAEFAFMLALVVIAALAAVTFLGGNTETSLATAASSTDGAGGVHGDEDGGGDDGWLGPRVAADGGGVDGSAGGDSADDPTAGDSSDGAADAPATGDDGTGGDVTGGDGAGDGADSDPARDTAVLGDSAGPTPDTGSPDTGSPASGTTTADSSGDPAGDSTVARPSGDVGGVSQAGSSAETATAWSQPVVEVSGDKWRGNAAVSLFRADGTPLGVDGQVQVETTLVVERDGVTELRSRTTWARLRQGVVEVKTGTHHFGADKGDRVAAVTFEVRDVRYQENDAGAAWDGVAPSVMLAPPGVDMMRFG